MQAFELGRERRRAPVCASSIVAALAIIAATLSPTGAAAHEAAAVTIGSGHTCGLTKASLVRCWGSNNRGQLGIGVSGDRHTPATVIGLQGVKAISAGGDHTCAITHAGGVVCWGDNDSGQLGNGSTNSAGVFVPVAVQGLDHGIVAIAAGYSSTCALTSTSAVKCWGNNASGQLGNNSTENSSIPVDVHGLSSGVSDIGAGQAHACAVRAGGSVVCWGWNGSGQLGDGTKGNQRLVPVRAKQVQAVVGLAVGGDHTCGRTGGDLVLCWGENALGELGDGNTTEVTGPARVRPVHSPVTVISGGSSHTCIVTADENARCWGNNVYGEIGNGTHNAQSSAVVVKRIRDAASISAGNNTSCAILTNGRIVCWGSNEFGELGNGTTNDSTLPVKVIGF